MTEYFAVDLDELEQMVARLAGLAGFVTEHLDEIDQRVASLQGSAWEGVAARAYSDAHRQWAVGAREFVDGIRAMSDVAKAAHGHYTAAVETNLKMLRS